MIINLIKIKEQEEVNNKTMKMRILKIQMNNKTLMTKNLNQ